MLRRASRSLLPLAIRAVGAPRVFHGAISAAVNPKKDTLAPNFHGASSPRFSTLAKPSSDQEQTVETMADGFPFKIQNSENAITMLREWKDETITLEVGIPQDDGFDMPFRPVYSATLIITKEHRYLKLGVRIAPDKFSIKSFWERETDTPLHIKAEDKAKTEDEAESDSDCNSGYEAEAEAEAEAKAESGSDTDSYTDYRYEYYNGGMDYYFIDDVDDSDFELHWKFSPYDKGLAKFLKRRGITLEFTNYLHDYITTHMRKRRYELQDLAGEP